MRLVVLAMCFLAAGSLASAQTPSAGLDQVLTPGRTVWITESGGQESKMRIAGVSGGVITASADGALRRFETTDIVRVRARQSDSLFNGAVIGAGAAIGAGLLLCTATEPWENCRDDVGPMLRIGALGAGIGIAVDALIRGRKTIYEAAPGLTGLRAAPILSNRARGVQVSLSF